MPMFRYEVTDRNGKTLAGAMDAASEGDVHQALASRGYTVKQILSSAGAGVKAPAVPSPRADDASRVIVPASEMAIFFRSIHSYLTSGMTLYQALVEVSVRTPDRGLRLVAGRIAERTEAGEALSVCMADFPGVFLPHVAGLTSAGELGGFLPAVMGDIAQDYELTCRASARWMRWLNKLLWACAFGNCLAAPLLPKFFTRGTATTIGTIDPLTGIMSYVRWTLPHVALPMAILLLAYFIVVQILSDPGRRRLAHRWLLKVPASWRDASRDRSLALFTKTLWRLQNGGILPIQAWDAASHTAENLVIADALQAQTPAVRDGAKFSDAMVATGYFTDADERVLATGEKSGQTEGVLQRIALHYEDAAVTSTGKARWAFLRLSIWACLLTGAWLTSSFITFYDSMMDWIPWYFEEAP